MRTGSGCEGSVGDAERSTAEVGRKGDPMTNLLRLLWRPLLMLAGLVGAGMVLRSTGFDPRQAVATAGEHGPPAFLLIGMLACAAGLPRQIVAMAGGYAFGFWSGCALALLAEIGGCVIDFAWARLLGRRVALRLIERRAGGRLHRLDRFLSERAFTATLSLRLLPLGNNLLLNLVAGVSGVAVLPFLAASLIGYVPQTVVFALAGAGAGVSDGVQFGLAMALLLVSVALGFLLLRRRSVPA
jgi:uncharacterized membrane protein YdjX (TVP38/TMEM64 family)